MEQPRPKILYLVHRVPYPPNRGDRIRSFHLLKFLAERGEVFLGFLTEDQVDGPTMEVLEGLCARVAAVRLDRYSRWVRAARSLVAGRTATEGLFQSREMKQTVYRWSEQCRFDAAVAFCSSMVQYLDAPGLADVPVVVDLVDVDSQKWFDYAELARGPKSFLFRLEGERLRRLEAGLGGRASAITLVSEAEVELYRSFCLTDGVSALPNGVDLDYFRPNPSNASCESRQCVFVGALDYQANIDGVTWFCKEVWPEIRSRCPEARFAIVGSRPTSSVRRLAGIPGVQLVGEVPDVRPHLAASAVAVVPLRVARGIQNKVLEALAMAKAVVATPQAVEGLKDEVNTSLRVAAAPAAWTEAVAALLERPDDRDRLGAAGRLYVEKHHEWSAQLAPLGRLSGLDAPVPRLSGRREPTLAVR